MLRKIGSIIFSSSKILGSLAWVAPTLYFQKRRAITIFQSELRAHGLDDQAVRELTELYRKMGEIRNWMGKPHVG